MPDARTLTVWWCDLCGYGRIEKTTGVHQTNNPEDPRGRMVRHELRPVVFVAAEDLDLTVTPKTGPVAEDADA